MRFLGRELAPTTSNPELERVLEYYRGVFGPEDIPGTIVDMKVGDGGWCAYWAATPDTAGRHWLGPLFRVEAEPFDSAAFVRREPEGFIVDFRGRVVSDRDHYYEELLPAEAVDAEQRPHGIPVVDVIGEDYQLPGYYDRNPELPRPQGYAPPSP
jgi:hypothetical protein